MSDGPRSTTPAELLKRAREKKGWTQKQLADAIGVTSGFVAKLEAAESLPGYERSVAMAEVLGLPLDQLWHSIQEERAESTQRRIQTRGVAIRGAVRGAGGEEPKTSSPEEIAREIASDSDLSDAYQHLKTALNDPRLRITVLTALEAFARAAAPTATVPAQDKKR
jgi:transcriptional regulator with XRE-family HTH domain